jgi:hypothetical protein
VIHYGLEFSGAKQAAEKGRISGEELEKHTSRAEAHIDFIGFMPGINPRPTARMVFPQHVKPSTLFGLSARLNSCPVTKRAGG